MNIILFRAILDLFNTIGKILDAFIDLSFSIGIAFVVANGIILAIKVSRQVDPGVKDELMKRLFKLGVAFGIIALVWMAYGFLLSGTIESLGS
jgi:small-conductance mechanosensitive channel